MMYIERNRTDSLTTGHQEFKSRKRAMSTAQAARDALFAEHTSAEAEAAQVTATAFKRRTEE